MHKFTSVQRGDALIRSIMTGRLTHVRRKIWFWEAGTYKANGWRKSETGGIRPVMIFDSPLNPPEWREP